MKRVNDKKPEGRLPSGEINYIYYILLVMGTKHLHKGIDGF